MIKAIARFAAAAFAAVGLALAGASTAGAVIHPSAVDGCSAVHPGFCGTWGTQDGTAFMAAQGSPFHPASATFTNFSIQAGSGVSTSFYMTHPARFSLAGENGALVQFSNAHAAESQNLFLNGDLAGHVTFTHNDQIANVEWIFVDSGDGVNGFYLNGATGRALCVGAHGAISTVLVPGAACTLLHFVPAS